MKPDERFHGLPWYDGKVVYHDDRAVPLAIAATEADAAAIVVALSAWPSPAPKCTHFVSPEKSAEPPSFYCLRPAVAMVGRVGSRCGEHIEPGAELLPVEWHPDLWAAVRRLLAVWQLPPGPARDLWLSRCVGDLATMRLGYKSQVTESELLSVAVASEREACARACDALAVEWSKRGEGDDDTVASTPDEAEWAAMGDGAHDCALAIRGRALP